MTEREKTELETDNERDFVCEGVSYRRNVSGICSHVYVFGTDNRCVCVCVCICLAGRLCPVVLDTIEPLRSRYTLTGNMQRGENKTLCLQVRCRIALRTYWIDYRHRMLTGQGVR